MDAAQWKLESNSQGQERKVRPQEQVPNCPRCKSTNTKFCYYNNYSLTQPRYFCKACRRYWTQGGSLRNVPVGGGSRKNKRSSPTPKPVADLSSFSSQNFTTQKGQDLNLGFQTTQQEYNQRFSQFLKLPKPENANTNHLNFLPSSAQDLLRTGTVSNAMFNRTQEFKPTMRFPFHESGIKYEGFQEYQQEMALPFGVLNQQLSSTRESAQNMEQGDSSGYWNGTLDTTFSNIRKHFDS